LNSVSGDLLAASSLLVALVGLLYSTWYAEITAAAETLIPLHDASKPRSNTRSTLRMRAAPLLLLAIVLVLLLLPPALTVVIQALQHLFGSRPDSHYDAVQACFIAVYLALLVLVVTLWTATRRVWLRLKELEKVPD
jgi:uncharacterized BrkB/YihY/UPF0761 family membrane protein